jgi:hypothetical protein
MEMMSEDDARSLRDGSNQISCNYENDIIMMWKQNIVIYLRK